LQNGETVSQAIERITARRYRLEADEESLVELAASQGFAISRRMNASPAAVLGVRIVKAAEMVAA
jgi:hypothetical protein